MIESNTGGGSDDQTAGGTISERNLVNIVYILYLASLILGITAVIGVVIGYVNRRDDRAWLATHYDFLIRTFWIGLLYIAISVVATFIVIGFGLLLLWYVWLIVRCARGMKYLSRGEAYPNPTSWLFG